jgi:methyl-accepting chemotaxis protein
MALDIKAAVKIQASVDGIASINGLEKSLTNLDRKADGLNDTFGRIKGGAGAMSGALGALVPAVAVGGLTTMAKGAIDAADNLNDLSQRTGVSVESLSRFGAAANDSGSSVDEVAKAMGKLSKSIVDPASKANEALKSIGVSATDASGKIRPMDDVMLDIADRFAKMPDGAQKTALAMELFGKSGMNLIPMLNQGRDALSKYNATMTTEGAQAADKFNDSLNEIARVVAGPFNQAVTALLPLITQIAEGLAGAITAFTQLPAPVQGAVLVVGALAAAFLALAPAISAIITIGPALAAGLAGLGAAFGAIVPIVTGLGTVLAVVFTGPVGIAALVIAAGIAIYAFRDKIGDAFNSIGEFFKQLPAGFKSFFIDPLVEGFRILMEMIYNTFIKPVQEAFTATLEFINVNFVQPIQTAFSGLVESIKTIFSKVVDFITSPFKAAFETVRGIVNQILNSIGSAIRSVVNAINGVIRGANQALAAAKLPQIPLLPSPNIPSFAEGGVVSGPTLAMVGEGGEPEYIVPQSKATKFANNWLSGVRGAAAIPKFAEGGVVVPGNAQVSIQTGPVTQMNGTNFVTTQDLSSAVAAGVNQTLSLLRNDMNTRRTVGLA